MCVIWHTLFFLATEFLFNNHSRAFITLDGIKPSSFIPIPNISENPGDTEMSLRMTSVKDLRFILRLSVAALNTNKLHLIKASIDRRPTSKNRLKE